MSYRAKAESYRGGRVNPDEAPPPPPALPTIQPRSDEYEREAQQMLERLRLTREQIPDCGGWARAFALELKDREDPQKVTPTVRAMYREALENWKRTHLGPVPQVQRQVAHRRAA